MVETPSPSPAVLRWSKSMACYTASKPICPTPHEVGIATLKRKRRHAASSAPCSGLVPFLFTQ
jgi:hypothetical protein